MKRPKSSRSPAYLPEIEIPNSMVQHAADDFADAARTLFKHHKGVAPMYVAASFAIELYLKSLNSSNVYTRAAFAGAYKITARSNIRGHDLADLYRALDRPLRTCLQRSYRMTPVVKKAPTLLRALSIYNRLFVSARYPFERDSLQNLVRLQGRTVNELLALVRFFGDYLRGFAENHQVGCEGIDGENDAVR